MAPANILIINIDDPIYKKFWNFKYCDFRAALAAQKYNIVEVGTVEHAIKGIQELPHAVLVVGSGLFEEGTTDNYSHLHRLLRSYAEDSSRTVVFCANVAVYMDREHANTIFKAVYELDWTFDGYMKKRVWVYESGKEFTYEAAGMFIQNVPEGQRLACTPSRTKDTVYCVSAARFQNSGAILFVGDYYIAKNSLTLKTILGVLANAVKNRKRIDNKLTIPETVMENDSTCRHCRAPAPEGKFHPYTCEGCHIPQYCSDICRCKHLPTHMLESGCKPPELYQRILDNNHFVRIFGDIGISKDDWRDTIIRLVDSYRLYIQNHDKERDFYRPRAGINVKAHIMESDCLVDNFKRWLRRAKVANAVPVWWDETWEKECIDFATWNSRSEGIFKGMVLGGANCDVFLGRIVDKAYIRKQYGENYGIVIAQLVELAEVISRVPDEAIDMTNRFGGPLEEMDEATD